MIRYQMPDGVEVVHRPELDAHLANQRRPRSFVEHPSYGVILVEDDKLTKVEPPLPPEPPNGYIGRSGQSGAQTVWQRDDRDAWSPGMWWSAGFEGSLTWAEVCSATDGTQLVPLVPDPAHGMPELPLELVDEDGDELEITTADRHVAIITTTRDGCYLAPDKTRQVITALSRLLREFEVSTSERAT